jgi:5-methyltetrahydrofolate--homocysteine methyltransferase
VGRLQFPCPGHPLKGSRYNFGYPACPDRIGVTLTEECHIVPEQCTSALIAHHPQAKYFNVRES